jgi:NADH dehydrogenase FAD-containing subunit
LLKNLRAAIAMQAMTAYPHPTRTLSLLSCGSRYAIAAWGSFSVEGDWVWRLKNRIDRQFVKRYSA